jgi:hypothetical protein
MASYIILDGKRYAVAITRYEPAIEKSQSVDVTVGGATVSQTFAFTDYRWGFDLLVSDQPPTNYGSLADLKTAYAKAYVSFTDHYGTNQGNVYFVGPLSEKPLSPMLTGAGAKFTVPVLLRKRQGG